MHGAFASDAEVKKVVTSLTSICSPQYDQKIINICEKAQLEENNESSGNVNDNEDYDEFYDEAVNLVLQTGKASASMIQRKFRIGYNRASRIVELMEKEGIVGPMGWQQG